MTTDAIYEERGSDWSYQVSVVRQLDGYSVTRPFLSLRRVWLADPSSLCERCGLRDYDDECTCHATLAAYYQLAQSVLKIGFLLTKKAG